MTKYIDAEKLKTKLNERIELLENGDAHSEVMKRVEGIIKGYKAALTIINSLQQEQLVEMHDFPSWKPSEEQMRVLKQVEDRVAMKSGYWEQVLDSLYLDLQKL